MGLRCSLLGHDFGDIVVERETDDRGSEVVVTERELRECSRCNAESIVSENTEVRRRRPEESSGGSDEQVDTTDAEGTEPLVEEAESSAAAREQEAEDAIILDDAEASDARSGQERDETPADQGTGSTVASPSEPQTTEGEETARQDSAPGDAARNEAQTTASQNEPVTESPASSAEAPADEPRSTGGTEGDDDGAGFTFAREETDATDPEATDAPTSGIKSAGPIDLTGPTDGTLDGILHCPACGFSIPIARSSNRAGDICPDCHAGYLAEER